MDHTTTHSSRPGRRTSKLQRRMTWTGLLTILSLLVSLFPQVVGQPMPTASAHNLQTKMVYMFFDPNTQTMLDTRIAGPTWTPPTPLLKVGDELGIIIKVMPRDGTTTGVGGHVDFYVPNGVTVVDAAYLMPGDANPADGISGYDKVPMKGQSLIAVGDGPIGAKTTTQLIGLGTVGPNVLGFSTNPVVVGTGLHRGTIAGVYGDTGIFYSTDPDTSFGSWQRFSNPGNLGEQDRCGLVGTFALGGAKTLTNNSGDVYVPCNKWDAEQAYAWGVKGTTYTGPGFATAPIVDYGDGRGNAPWGFASGVGGPQSGYGWNFNWDEWAASAKTAADMRNAMGNDEVGPWQRIRYNGSRIASDQPGLTSTTLGIASVDGGSVGRAVSSSSPLPATTSQSDTTSPKAIRWAVGQLTSLVPEFVWVKLKVDSTAAIVNADGCPVFNGDTFGGDAGGSDNGKDHLWRYYEPSKTAWNGCLALGKPATRDLVKVGDTYQYKLKVYNAGTINDFTNVVVKDTLPAGVQFISAFPTQQSGPNPLTWTIPSIPRGTSWEATVTVKATGTGPLENTFCVDAAGTNFDQCATDITTSGPYPMLRQGKTAAVTTVAPGANVQYTIQIDNIGGGPTGSPVTVLDYLPTGFTFTSKNLVTINGADVTGTTPVNTGTPGQALFTVPGALNAGQSLVIKYTTNVPPGTPAGTYCNSYTTTQNGVPLSTGSLACITVGAGAIGDTIFRDWNGNGVRDAGEEGIAGVTVELRNSSNVGIATTTTDANGNYIFEGLAAGTYTVKITDLGPDGIPATGDEELTNYTQTYDPDSTCPSGGCNGQSTVTLTTGQRNLDQDFGYKPGGAGSIGDTLWKDNGAGAGETGNGVQDAGELGIANVTVLLYEDTNGNGAIDPDDVLVNTAGTDGNGNYIFTGLAVNLNYLVKIDENDPQFVAAFTGPGSITPSTPALQGAQPTTDEPAVLTVDFGYYQTPPAAVGDTVCSDGNGDQLCTVGSNGDTALPNIDVLLYGDSNGNGVIDPGEPLLATDTTDANGVYGFSSLPAGPYVVVVNTSDPDLPGGLAATRNPQGVNLASGETNNDIDFPFVSRLTKAVSAAFANPGDILTYTITPNYTGRNLLNSVKVTDAIPTGTTYVPDSDTPEATVTPADNTTATQLAWDLGTNTPGQPGVAVLCPVEQNVFVDADTWIDQDTGGSANLKIYGGDNTLTTRDDTSAQDNFALMHFPIGTGTLPAGAAVQKATLNAFIQNGGNTGRALNVYELTTAWVEGTANGTTCNGTQNGANWAEPDCDATGFWASGNNTTGFSSADYNPTALGSLPATSNTQQLMTSAALTQLVKDWVAGTNTNEGLAFLPNLTNQDISLSAREDGVTNDAYITIKYLVPQTGACSINTDGQAIFSVKANTPKYNPFNGATNAWAVTATDAATLANKQHFLALASGTTRSESIATAVLDNSTVAGQVWNGASWSVIPGPLAGANGQLGTVSAKTFYSTDVAYESVSGDAVVVWDDNAQTGSNKLRYATYDGTMWSAATNTGPAYTGGEPLYMNLASKPSADGMVLVVNDLTFDDYAVVWDGATNAWGNGLSLDTSGTAPDDRTSLDAAYETSSGDAMVVYAKHNDAKVYYRILSGGTWGGEFSVAAPSGVTSQPQWLVLASDPNSDRLALAVLTIKKTVWLSVWDGATNAWGAQTTATTGAQTEASPVVSVAFESLNGRALAVYGEGKNVRYRTWSSVSNAWTAELNGPVLASNTATLLLDADPNSNEIMLTAMGSGKKVQANLWSGSSWGALTQLSGDTNYPVGQPFDFHWQQNVITQPNTKTALTTNRTLVTDTGGGVAIQVQLTVESALAGSVTATPLTVTSAGAGATCNLTSPTNPQGIAANGTVQFTYACTVTAGATVPGSVTFKTTPTGVGTGGFVEATSNSVLATPRLTYQAAVKNPATVTQIKNTAQISEVGGTIPPTDSNETLTTIPGGSIGDYVWWDDNLNGTPDSGELPVPDNTIVLLYRDVDNNGILDPLGGDVQVGGPAYTSGGAYLFGDLPPGNYLVDVYEDSIAAQYIPYLRNIVPTTADVQYKSLAQGENYLNADFGYFKGALVEGNVFWDEDHNGVLDPGEQNSLHLLNNIAVTIVCYGPDGVPGGSDDRTYTHNTGQATPPPAQPNGHFAFIVPPGPCTLTYDTTQTTAAGYPEATTPVSYSFTAEAGEDWHPTFDFGVDNAGKIGDRVWNDANGNGAQNVGEPGLTNVTVYLCSSTPCNSGNAIATTATDADGAYQFVGLPDGTHYVGVDTATVPAGYTQTGYGDPGTPCGACTSQSPAIPISGGNTVPTVDFGYRPPLTGVYPVSGRVWNDVDGGGTQNGAEPGIPGVKVCLYDSAGTVVIACTATLANGDYTFPGVTPGTYVIKVDTTTLPSTAYYQTGDPDTTKDNKTTVTVSTAAVTNKNFGYDTLLGSISGTVCDGTLAPLGDCVNGETTLANVPVFLTYAGQDGVIGTADDVVYNTTTVGNGSYTFLNLAPGRYQITTITPTGKSALADADGGNPNNISVILDFGFDGNPNTADDRMVKVNQDFEVKPAAGAIGDRVWLDTNGNGVQDPGEPGLANVVVELKDGAGNPIDSDPSTVGVQPTLATTDMNGNYLFVGVPAGNYQVDVVSGVPAGLVTSLGTSDPRLVTLAVDQSYLDADFGYTGPDTSAVIGDYVWADVDADGIQDPGEVGIGGVTVELKLPNNSVIATTTTDPDGSYLFANVAPGQYLVQVSGAVLTGYTPTVGPQSEGAYTSAPVTVVAGDVVTDVDFGFDKPELYSISDRVWYDVDGDGALDPGESGIGGVTVNLLDSNDKIIATTTSNPDGTFTFPGVPGGSYTIEIADNGGVLSALQPTTPSASAGERPVVVTNSNVTGTNFGYAGAGLIGDTVFNDLNVSGTQDPGEPGIPNVQVRLYLDDGDGVFEPGAGGDVLIDTQTTDANGNYLFKDLPVGTFWASVDNAQAPLTGFTLTTPDASVNPPNSAEYKVTLTSLVPGFLAADFGYKSLNTASIGNFVWWDINNDGVQEAGEPGIPDVTVELLQNNIVIATRTTDGSGLYNFTNLANGDYQVRIWAEEFISNANPGSGTLKNWVASPKDAGSPNDDTKDSDGDPTTHVAPVTLAGGVGTADIDFGFTIASSYEITKKLTSANPFGLGEPVTFEITIKNTGNTWLSTLPLQDSYNNTYLTYGFGGMFATPDSDPPHNNVGVINWTDLTAASPYGFGADIAPGATKTVLISFTARTDTSALGAAGTTNTVVVGVVVGSALADPDGSGPLLPLVALPSLDAFANVQIYTPTGVTMEAFGAAVEGRDVLVNWRSASEGEILGYNVQRQAEGGEFVTVSPELIMAENAGQDRGAAYTFRDMGVPPGAYTYRVEVVKLDGSIETYGAAQVVVQP